VDTPIHVSAGTLFAGDFRIARQLSAGGMGVIYAAQQASTGRPRALKLMHPQLVTDDKLRARFEQEARVGSLIPSEHVVEVIGAGVDEETGIPWIAMELLEGEDLDAYVSRRGPLPPAEVVEVLRQACHALGAAHRVGVVHRDLKPENIFVGTSQNAEGKAAVKILDFGISKVVAEAHRATTTAIGTPLWMAPEQSEPRAPVTPAADVWSLGLVAFWMLTGKLFWSCVHVPGVSMQAVLRELLFEPIPAASRRAEELGCADRLPPGFDAWFARCVRRTADERFQDASEAFEALRAALPDAAAAAVTLPPAVRSGTGDLVRRELSAFPVGMATKRPSARARQAPADSAARRAPLAAVALGAMVALTVAGGAGAYALGLVRFGREQATPSAPPMASEAPPPSAVATWLPAPSPAEPRDPIAPSSAAPSASVERSTRPAPVRKRRFDPAEAARALERAAQAARLTCAARQGPRGFTLKVHYARAGHVQRWSTRPELMGAETVMCAAGLLGSARIAPFDVPEEPTATVAVALD
jgi:hypothetical protein